MRKIMMLLTAMAGLSVPVSAKAQTIEEQIVSQLEEQGYTDIEIYHTLLGRLRILAKSGDTQRELVILPASGEVLRDHSSRIIPDRVFSSGTGLSPRPPLNADGSMPEPPDFEGDDHPDLPDSDGGERPERPGGERPEREERKN